jgi:hypothetical protein
MMKTTYFAGVVIVAVAMLIALTGCAMADIPVNATPETKGITVTTNINAQGTVTASDSLTWQQSNTALNAPPLTADEVQYTAGYTEATLAVQGVTSYTKTTAIDTANKIADKNNIAANKIVTFIAANEQGRMTSSEDILVDGAGNQTTDANKILCPFGQQASGYFPPFCNVVMSGSKVDVSLASISTSASERFVAATADVPVVQAYSISGKGVTSSEGSADAIGSMSAFMTAHLMDGRMVPTGVDEWTAYKAEDISYSNSVSASGIIKAFSQSYTYQSGIRRI